MITLTKPKNCSNFVRRTVPILFGELSPFEKRVYDEVSKIPKGEVQSYKYIAIKIGKPKAYRAVANALHKNPFALKVPCHRVIKSDGTIGGFSQGVAMKKKMLLAEGLTIKGNVVIIDDNNSKV